MMLLETFYQLVLVVLQPVKNLAVGVGSFSLLWQ